LFNLKAAVAREQAVQAIDVHREFTNCVVTFWVMSQLFHFLGASRGCADCRDPTAAFRFKEKVRFLGGRITTQTIIEAVYFSTFYKYLPVFKGNYLKFS
jgi:hypothetical protein